MDAPNLCCPKCGCNDVRSRPARSLWGDPGFDCDCNFCGCRFQVADPEAETHEVPYSVEFVTIHCPHCGGKKTEISSTRHKRGEPTIRYHRCRDCDKPFKSVEPA